MAKIDTSKIEGFDAMSAEDKITALLGYEVEVPAPVTTDPDTEKLRAALSKANSEAAEYKRALREKQTEAERAEAERAEAARTREEKLAELEKRIAISDMEKKYLAAGYPADLAAASAKAFADSDTDEVFRIQMDYIEATKKSIEAAALGKQPPLSVGKPPEPASREDAIAADAMKYAGLS